MHEIMHLMSKLFEKKPPEELRSERLRVWFTKDEKAQVELLADMRRLAMRMLSGEVSARHAADGLLTLVVMAEQKEKERKDAAPKR